MKEILNDGVNIESKERLSTKPYVVSADIELLSRMWGEPRGFKLPTSEFFSDLRSEFQAVTQRAFSSTTRVDIVPEDGLNEIRSVVQATGLPTISLDRVYFQSPDFRLDLTRSVDADGEDKGIIARSGALPVNKQLMEIVESGIREAVLVDDVIFSGNLAMKLCEGLANCGIDIPIVCAGIGVREGVDKIRQSGREVKLVKEYGNVVDQICERDFYPGMPFSGRTLVSGYGNNIGVPYLYPFGQPVEWASIPEESAFVFSDECLKLTGKLYRAIEKASDRSVLVRDLDRQVLYLSRDSSNRMVVELEQARRNIENQRWAEMLASVPVNRGKY